MSDQTFQENKRQFSELLQARMKEKRLSNMRLAKLAGISEGTIRKILRDDDPRSFGPHPQVLKAICQVLDLDAIMVFQLLEYLPPSPSRFVNNKQERIAFRISRLPQDKEKILLSLLDSLEESAGLRTPDTILDYTLKAVYQLRKDHPMFEKRNFGLQDEIGHLSVRFTPAWQIPPMRSELVKRFQFVFRDDPSQIISELRLDELLNNSSVVLALQMLLPRKDVPSPLEKLYWLCFWDKAYGASTEKLSEEHQNGFRVLWLLLCSLITHQVEIPTK